MNNSIQFDKFKIFQIKIFSPSTSIALCIVLQLISSSFFILILNQSTNMIFHFLYCFIVAENVAHFFLHDSIAFITHNNTYLIS